MKIEKIQYGPYEALRLHFLDRFLDYIPKRAQIIRYGFLKKPDILWGNSKATYQDGKAIRSGIPLCWPWFGHLKANPSIVQNMHSLTHPALSHGFARCIEWKNHQLDASKSGIIIINSLQTSPTLTPEWPHETELKFIICFNEILSIQLHIENKSNQDIAITQALHNYFHVSDIRNIHIHGLENLTYTEQNALGQQKSGIQKFFHHLTGPVDRIYSDVPSEITIIDPIWKRNIIIRAPFSHSAVLWTPWKEQAKTLDQFPASLWNQVMCLEVGTLLNQMQIIKPKTKDMIEMSIHVTEHQ
ncbi:D-hexose-6-phosphate mutarotase [Commensalibacter melissae]|uniref:D-hexose-6-phosphate mutarotase n=1 Tax=Commensalibacter melissae TaxID=2070537 RepID=UPI0012D8F5F7|nr:hypothetical protein [Commensalibacter melissae]MUG80521.1 hypothetical protein [Commensalibacter melissae]